MYVYIYIAVLEESLSTTLLLMYLIFLCMKSCWRLCHHYLFYDAFIQIVFGIQMFLPGEEKKETKEELSRLRKLMALKRSLSKVR